jgi:hypothetical protein
MATYSDLLVVYSNVRGTDQTTPPSHHSTLLANYLAAYDGIPRLRDRAQTTRLHESHCENVAL